MNSTNETCRKAEAFVFIFKLEVTYAVNKIIIIIINNILALSRLSSTPSRRITDIFFAAIFTELPIECQPLELALQCFPLKLGCALPPL